MSYDESEKVTKKQTQEEWSPDEAVVPMELCKCTRESMKAITIF